MTVKDKHLDFCILKDLWVFSWRKRNAYVPQMGQPNRPKQHFHRSLICEIVTFLRLLTEREQWRWLFPVASFTTLNLESVLASSTFHGGRLMMSVSCRSPAFSPLWEFKRMGLYHEVKGELCNAIQNFSIGLYVFIHTYIIL